MTQKTMPIDWTFHPTRDFAAQAATWDGINARGANLPFLESLFVAPLVAAFGSGRETLAVGRSGGEPVAALLLQRAGTGRWSTFQPSQMPLGPVVALPTVAVDSLADSLLRALPGFNLGLGLTELDPLYQVRPANRPCFGTLDYIQTAWVELAGDFAAYWESRGKNLRQNMRKQRNKLQADGVAPTLEILRDAAAMREAISQYGALETASWKAAEGTAVSLDNDQGRFYLAMMENFCRAGRGVVYRYRLGEQVAAMDLCIERDDLLVILKTTYDGSNRSLSPAFLMREEQMQQLYGEGRIKRIEFYGKLMEWHTRWTDQARTLYHANAYRFSVIPRLLQWRARRAAPQAAATTAPEAENA